MIRLILWLSVFWIVPVMTYMLINETKFHKNIVLGVTLPQEARDNEEIKGVLAKFRRDSIIVCAGLLVLAAVFCFLSSDQKPMTIAANTRAPTMKMPTEKEGLSGSTSR